MIVQYDMATGEMIGRNEAAENPSPVAPISLPAVGLQMIETSHRPARWGAGLPPDLMQVPAGRFVASQARKDR